MARAIARFELDAAEALEAGFLRVTEAVGALVGRVVFGKGVEAVGGFGGEKGVGVTGETGVLEDGRQREVFVAELGAREGARGIEGDEAFAAARGGEGVEKEERVCKRLGERGERFVGEKGEEAVNEGAIARLAGGEIRDRKPVRDAEIGRVGREERGETRAREALEDDAADGGLKREIGHGEDLTVRRAEGAREEGKEPTERMGARGTRRAGGWKKRNVQDVLESFQEG